MSSRLSDGQRRALGSQLEQWSPPSEYFAAVQLVIEGIGSSVFFGQAGLEFLRDAFIAARVAILRDADSVRLIADNWPDFELKFGCVIEQFEAVEAYDSTRRRANEYADEASQKIREDPLEDQLKRASSTPDWIAGVVQAKIDKNYSERRNLVVYLGNSGTYGRYDDLILSKLHKKTKRASAVFSNVWVLFGERLLHVWAGSDPLPLAFDKAK